MQGHASTRWLTCRAPATPAETITVVWALFDLSDQMLDSIILLDHFRWGCDPNAGEPMTMPDATDTGADGTSTTNTSGP